MSRRPPILLERQSSLPCQLAGTSAQQRPLLPPHDPAVGESDHAAVTERPELVEQLREAIAFVGARTRAKSMLPAFDSTEEPDIFIRELMSPGDVHELAIRHSSVTTPERITHPSPAQRYPPCT